MGCSAAEIAFGVLLEQVEQRAPRDRDLLSVARLRLVVGAGEAGQFVAGGPGGLVLRHGEGVLQRADTRHTIDLSTGVRWERLTPRHDSRVDFLDVVYEPYGRSS